MLALFIIYKWWPPYNFRYTIAVHQQFSLAHSIMHVISGIAMTKEKHIGGLYHSLYGLLKDKPNVLRGVYLLIHVAHFT